MTTITSGWFVLHAQHQFMSHGVPWLYLFAAFVQMAGAIFCVTLVIRDMRHK